MRFMDSMILTMLSDLSKPEEDRELDWGLIDKALSGGHLWALEKKYGGIAKESKIYSRQVVEQTQLILDMWRVVESAFRDLTNEEKTDLVNLFGTHRIKFRGFDANNEPHWAVASFLIEEMGLWQFFSDRKLNSHSPMLDGYLRMLKECRRIGGFDYIRSELHLMRIFKAQQHPKND